jgi:ATP/maltotriose-dependent transcriptional regulator MalT/DNA-binding SARP family transcriptional activator
VAVGPGHGIVAMNGSIGDGAMDGGPGPDETRFPIQLGKIGRPALRDDTLERARLLDWLHAKVHHRMVLVVAEAGYGKTTLLADFSRRTRLRMVWYRLDEDDRDPVAFLNYLIAAGREVEPGFAPTTSELLRELGTGNVSRETLESTFARELAGLGTRPTVLVLDDLHLVDDSPDIRSILRILLSHQPDRLTIVALTRRRPRIPLARLRTLGEVAELETADLRFLPEETERLFRETYGQPLEPDVLEVLARRTEGWAASLQLARTALRRRSAREVRQFVYGLSGSSEELYDYLAEEVVGELDPTMQSFLMRTAILQVVDAEGAGVVTREDPDTVRGRIEAAERAGLLGRRSEAAAGGHRYHPLVQEFLLDRLRREVGEPGVTDLHRVVARWADGRDWRVAAHHFAAARDAADLHRVLGMAIGSIMATGEFAHAESLLERLPPSMPEPALEVFLSRLDFYRNRVDQALDRARLAYERIEDERRDAALGNLASLQFMRGLHEDAMTSAALLYESAADPLYRDIGRAIGLGLSVSEDGAIDPALETLSLMADDHRSHGMSHFLGITLNNAISLHLARGEASRIIELAGEAEEALEGSSAGPELAGLYAMHATALMQIGRMGEATALFVQAEQEKNTLARAEVLLYRAEAETWYGSLDAAKRALAASRPIIDSPDLQAQWDLADLEVRIRAGDTGLAQEAAWIAAPRWSSRPAQMARRMCVQAHWMVATGRHEASTLIGAAYALADRQGATFWARYALLLAGLVGDRAALDTVVRRTTEVDPALLGLVAEGLVERLDDISDTAIGCIRAESRSRPARWLTPLRNLVSRHETPAALVAAELLDEVGDAQDVSTLRSFSRRARAKGADPNLGRNLAKRLAPTLFVEDLGRVEILVGSRRVPGADVRRRALSVLCYLLSRPNHAATRDQVLDALWPDHAPDDAQNSLNQTLYFLRRVFDPKYNEDQSAQYVRLESELVWLDPDLVQSRSQRCWQLLGELQGEPSDEVLESLLAEYSGRFALDFYYEEWASAFRYSLHAAFLEAVERSIAVELGAGSRQRAMAIARAAVKVDPEAAEVELSLLQIYRVSGAHAAAAEQSLHYSDHADEDSQATDSA